MKYKRRALQCTLFSFLVLLGVIPIYAAQHEPNIFFRDDFTGTSLNPKWRLIGPDNDRWTLIEGEYFLIVTTKAGTNVMQFAGALPKDYEVIIKIQTPPQHENQVVRISLQRNKENEVEIGYYPRYSWGGATLSRTNPEVYFSKVLKGKWSDIYKKVSRLGKDEPLYLKLSKHGVEYSGAYSVDGSTWINVGTHVYLNLDGKPTFDAYNHYHSTMNPPESGIRFDYFEIRTLR